MRLSIVDVFAEQRYQGNQLAVVRDAATLDSATMQSIAREMNFSETTFVIAQSPGSATVRIFTPGEELPFAGHPTLGTAYVLTGGQGSITLALAAGDVAVTLGDGLAWMQPPPSGIGEPIERDVAARIVGLEPDEIADDMAPRLMHSGAPYSLVPVASLGALRRVRVSKAELDRLGAGTSVFSVCRGGYSPDAHFGARMHFFDGSGMREDPATGSANSAFAACLRQQGERGERIVEQGFEIGRPSRIYLGIEEPIVVGGKVWPVAEGRLM